MSRRRKALLVLVVAIGVVVASYFLVPSLWVRIMYGLEVKRAGLVKQRVTAIGREVVYLEGGSGAETIVMLHGFGADKYSWVRFAALLAKRYRVVALDLPGFGETPALAGEEFDAESQTTRAHAILKALGLTRYHLIGNSMGGNVAGRIAHHWPNEVATLVLSDTHGVGFGDSLSAQKIKRGENPFLVKSDDDFRALTDMVFFKTPWIPHPIYAEQRDYAISHYDERARMFSDVNPDRETLLSLLSEIKTKTLILWGDHDQLIDVSRVKALEEQLVSHRTVIMKDCGHVPPLERPDETVEHYLKFLAER